MNKLWQGIYGQEKVKKTLEKLLDNSKIPHAFLFSGIDGIGKDFLSIRFAQALNQNYSSNKDIAPILSAIEKFSEPYIKYIFPLPRGKNETEESGPYEKLSVDEIQLLQEEINKKIKNPYYKISLPKAQGIKINSIRDIKKFLSVNYDEAIYRIILISDAHLMNETSQNALLKNLEEPPEGALFILTTPYPDLLRETIISRCWQIQFQPLNDNDIKDILIKYYNVDETLAEEISPFSNGSVTNAVNLLNHNFEKLRDKTILILRYSFGRKYDSALNEMNAVLSEGDSDTLKLLVQMIITWLNDILKFRLGKGNYFFSSYKETLQKFNEKFPEINPSNLVAKLENLISLLKNNVNPNIISLNIILELSNLTKSKNT